VDQLSTYSGSTARDAADDISERSNEQWLYSVRDTDPSWWTDCTSSTRRRGRSVNRLWRMCLGARPLPVRNRGTTRNRLPARMV